jgi:chromosome segregation ATPase
MEQIPRTKKLAIALGFLLGLSYREIEDQTGVSHGSIVNVAKEIRTGSLDIPGTASDQVDDVRQLSLDLRKRELSTSQALLGLQFFERCQCLGIDPGQLDQWAKLVNALTSDDFPQEDFLRAALRLHQLEKSEGKPFEVVAEEYQRTKEHLDQLTAEIDSSVTRKEDLLKEIKPLSLQKDTLTREKADLENRLRVLTKSVAELGSRVSELEKERSALVKETRELKRRKTKVSSEVEGKEESLARLADIGFRDEDLLRLRTIMERMASDDKADPQEVMRKLVLTLGSIRDLVELDQRRETETENLRQLTETKGQLEGETLELEKRRAILLGEISQAASSVTEEVKVVGEKALSELRVQVEGLRGSLGDLVTDTVRVAGVIGKMEAEVQNGERSGKDLEHLAAEVKAAVGRR